MSNVLIVGAGLGALALGADLRAAGVDVRLLDKSRGGAGRAATRRVRLEDGREARLDHGARFFTARGERLRALAQAGEEAGWLRAWATGFPTWEAGEIRPDGGGEHPRYAPVDGLSALSRHLGEGLDVAYGVTAARLERVGTGWRVHDTAEGVHEARRLVLNLPAAQASALLGDHASELRAAFAGVTYDPCWAVGAVLEQDLGADWPALRFRGHPALDWVAREHTKRPAGHPPALMVHAHADWSRAHLEDRPEDVQAALLAAAAEVVGDFAVLQTFAHRWRYAQPARRAAGAHFWDTELNLGACGDGFTPDNHGTRVEAALLSGWSLAAALGTA
ncbi:NAD(P)/FAD-dependent oxidoreductase [Deinococcus sp. Leaf326]|uniref:NAD(P)/FAD-dependent oxidoreductase n=1 Tax=Deinococcus sp. Leaf326 TaxID=1736338 RepID=UPI0006FBD08E|nr:NAD(P)-binding protein [Deinococcus sp. Leaf326]KQR04565.1 fumarate reductase [Deinococcus sp. Leaf326]